MPKAKDLTKLSDEELDAVHQAAMDERDAARAQAGAVQAERDRRALEAKLGGLTGTERDALVQMIQAEGVDSSEEVGEPGN